MDISYAERIIETIPSSNIQRDYMVLLTMANDEDEYIRSLAAENLVHLGIAPAMELLIRLTGDTDALVRTNAYDSLGSFNHPQVRNLLKKAARKEPDEVARFYALLSYADHVQAGTAAVCFFQKSMRDDSSAMCKLACSYALYQLGDDSQFDSLFDNLHGAEDYHVRCMAASFFQDILNENNREMVLAALNSALKTEASIAVSSRIREILREEGIAE